MSTQLKRSHKEFGDRNKARLAIPQVTRKGDTQCMDCVTL